MSHDDIKAALAKVNPTGEQWCIWNGWGPLVGTEDIHAATRIGTSDGDSGVHGRWTEDGDLYGSRDTLEFVASAPTWLAELLAENERLSVELERSREQYGYAVDRVQHHQERAEKAERAIQRVRDLAKYLSGLAGGDRHYADQILRALDGGAS